MKVKRFAWSSLIRSLAWLSLIAAFVIGQIGTRPDYEALLASHFPEATLTPYSGEGDGPRVFEFSNRQQGEPEVVILGQGDGYGGPMTVAITASRTATGARTHDVLLLADTETPPYIERLKKKHFFRQLANRSVTDDFLLDTDIDSYSGATITARGVSQAMRASLHLGAMTHLGLPATWTPDPWALGWDELGMLLLVAASIVVSMGSKHRFSRLLKTLLPLVSLLFVGFYTNASIGIGSISSIVLGYIPSVKQHPLWWILMGAILVGIVLLGRNVYCHKLCPFSTVQSLLTKVTGLSMKAPTVLIKHARSLILGLIWGSLMLILLSRHPSLGSYEPFSMMFALEGVGMQWYILPLSLFGAAFIPDFWCRYFCPVGLTINESVKLRRKAVNRAKAWHHSRRIEVQCDSGIPSPTHKGGSHGKTSA
ncbi:4Fe-4S binding protein [Ferrimonas sp. SCSIO 43195]|uniref:FMN-binding protein n=1 Tax=Ferrimonas sp. SCSIO 43195 TaxID=2822844 RepID=UPI002075FF78|nr:4Fe-4S binding protein [Ferrimonas sp. SCSIO 43195]USD39255.1 FMN-binding protein [Ferrimonas sp. SCSIO 43195]